MTSTRLPNGIELEHEVYGPPTGEPVLLVMGLGAQMIVWPLEFVDGVDRAHLGRLRDRHHGGLGVVLAPLPLQVGLELLGTDLPPLVRERDHHRAREPGRGAALVHDDVCTVGREHRLPRLEQRGEADDVGAGAAPAREALDWCVEHLAEHRLGLTRPRIGPVRDRRALVGSRERFEHLGRHAGHVVAGERAVGRWRERGRHGRGLRSGGERWGRS